MSLTGKGFIVVDMDNYAADLLAYQRTVLRLTDAEITNLTVAERLTINDQFLRARPGNNCVVFIMWLLSGDFISSSR